MTAAYEAFGLFQTAVSGIPPESIIHHWDLVIVFFVFLGFVGWAIIDREKQIQRLKGGNHHFAEIAHLLEDWKKYLDLVNSISHHFGFDYEVENELLFSHVLRHCPSVKKTYSALSAKREQYEQKKKDLRQKIAIEVPREAHENFGKTVVDSALQVAEGGTGLHYELNNNVHWLRVKSSPIASEAIGIIQGDTKEDLESYEQWHRKLVEKYSKEVKELLADAQTLRELGNALTVSIEVSQHKQEWKKKKCDWCP